MSESTMATELPNVLLTKTKRTAASRHGQRAVVTREHQWSFGWRGCFCKPRAAGEKRSGSSGFHQDLQKAGPKDLL